MNPPTTDMLGHPLTETESLIVCIHEQMADLLKRPDLVPAVRSGIAHALASTYQVLNDLNIEASAPSEI